MHGLTHHKVRAERWASADTASMGCAAGWLGMRWPGAAGAALGCCAAASPAKGAAAAGAKLRRSTAAAVGASARQKPARGHRLLQLPRKRGCSARTFVSSHIDTKERPFDHPTT
jgi:hypothetical protein